MAIERRRDSLTWCQINGRGENKHKPKSLRKKMAVTIAATGLATTALLSGISNPNSSAQNEPKTDPVFVPIGEIYTARDENITAPDVLKEINDKYGVIIPDLADPKYSSKDQITGETTPNYVPTLEEAEVIKDAIAKIPAAGFLSPIIIPFRNTDQGAIAGGAFLGQDWPWMLRPKDYIELPKDTWIGDKPAIELLIPDGSLNDALPLKTQDTANLPALEQISLESSGVKINLSESVPWTNQRERLKQTVVHELFHAFADKVSIANSPSIEAYWERQSFSLFNKNTWDITNPLYTTFAKLTGWHLESSYESMKQYDSQMAEKYKDVSENIMFWERDPKVWGDLAHRRDDLTIYSAYGPIQEVMAEYWMTYVLYPDLLTPDVRDYFGRIYEGLKNNPQEFIKQLVGAPDAALLPNAK